MYLFLLFLYTENKFLEHARQLSWRTVLNRPPDKICVIDLAMDGFSATHNTLIVRKHKQLSK